MDLGRARPAVRRRLPQGGRRDGSAAARRCPAHLPQRAPVRSQLGEGAQRRDRLHQAARRRAARAALTRRGGDADAEDSVVDHLKRVADEFARQAQTFDLFAEKTDEQVAARFAAALGDAGRGELIDVACGPGVVTAAIAARAASVVAFDATEQMLDKARARCAKAGLANVAFECGNAERLPFEDARFDGAVTRLAVHHFADPQRAIERLRDPSHVRMLPASELDACAARAGFREIEPTTWDKRREFEEWMDIVNDPARAEPIRTVVRALAEAGRTAGMGLSIAGGRIEFFHRWRLLRARKPP